MCISMLPMLTQYISQEEYDKTCKNKVFWGPVMVVFRSYTFAVLRLTYADVHTTIIATTTETNASKKRILLVFLIILLLSLFR